jgi:hypothetical protein
MDRNVVIDQVYATGRFVHEKELEKEKGAFCLIENHAFPPSKQCSSRSKIISILHTYPK